VVGVAVVGVLGLDAGVARERARSVAHRRVAARALVERLGVQVAVGGAEAGDVGVVEERRGARTLALLPDRLRAVEAGAALELAIQRGRRDRRREGLLGLAVAVGVEVAHAARDPLARGVRAHELGLGRVQRAGERVDALGRAIG